MRKTMHVRVLRNLGSGWPSLRENQVAYVDEETGRKLCGRGLAVEVEKPHEPVVDIVPDDGITAKLRAVPPRSNVESDEGKHKHGPKNTKGKQ